MLALSGRSVHCGSKGDDGEEGGDDMHTFSRVWST